MSDWLKVVVLGVVEGITEFLPISSTGHLIAVTALLDFQGHIGGTFEIFIQLGAALAVIAFYRAELFDHARRVRGDAGVQRLWGAVLVACIPVVAAGLLLQDWIKEHLFLPSVVGPALIAGGLVFLWIERRPGRSEPASDLTTITMRQALLVGVAQVLSLIPGVSRSGASIIGGLLVGMERRAATQFSFYLAIPLLLGATLYDLLTNWALVQSGDLLNLLVGTAVSALVAWLSIGWLLRYVAHHNFIPFGYYRIAIGTLLLLLNITVWR